MTCKEVFERIDECERNGVFDEHVDPIPRELVIPVDENYRYVGDRGFFENIKYSLEKFFCVWPFTWYENKFVLKTEYVGRENLRGLKAAVLTCNHVAKFDCLAVKYGARGHRTYTVAADFNNMRGTLGELMRAGDMLPLNTTLRGKIKFSKAVERVLAKKKQFLLVYPEAAMWRYYKKPRPFKNGAFDFAVKYNVPVVPQFITFEDMESADAEGYPKQKFTVHISNPVYPKSGLSKSENTEYLKNAAFDFCKKVYEETYKKPLEYTCDADDEKESKNG